MTIALRPNVTRAVEGCKLVTHVFRARSAQGYGEVVDVDARGRANPLAAPKSFALGLADLGID